MQEQWRVEYQICNYYVYCFLPRFGLTFLCNLATILKTTVKKVPFKLKLKFKAQFFNITAGVVLLTSQQASKNPLARSYLRVRSEVGRVEFSSGSVGTIFKAWQIHQLFALIYKEWCHYALYREYTQQLSLCNTRHQMGDRHSASRGWCKMYTTLSTLHAPTRNLTGFTWFGKLTSE